MARKNLAGGIMSFYSYLEGYIEFEKKEDFDKISKAIIDGGWYNPETNIMVYEGDEEVDLHNEVCDLAGNEVKKLIDPDRLSIAIPQANYRNLDRVFKLDGMKFKGEIQGDSDDGCNDAWIYRNGEYFSCDICEYAQLTGMDIPDIDMDSYCEDRYDVIESFHKEPEPKANSQKFIEEEA
jgi:hypothetical protein